MGGENGDFPRFKGSLGRLVGWLAGWRGWEFWHCAPSVRMARVLAAATSSVMVGDLSLKVRPKPASRAGWVHKSALGAVGMGLDGNGGSVQFRTSFRRPLGAVAASGP